MATTSGSLTVGTVEKMLFAFREVLDDLGVALPEDSRAARELADVLEVMKWIRQQDEPPISEEYRTRIQNMVCAIQLIELTLRRRREGHSLQPFTRHFKLLETGSMRLAAEHDSEEANHKLFELFVGLTVMAFASGVELDPPNNSTGRNPDVVATIGGKRWGFACKVPSSAKALSLHDSIQKGFTQVDQSEVDAGFVILTSKNIITSADSMPIGRYRGRPALRVQSRDAVTRKFRNRISSLMGEMDGLFGSVGEPVNPRMRLAVPYVFWIDSTALISQVGGGQPWRPTLQVSTYGSALPLSGAQQIEDSEVRQICTCFHDELTAPTLGDDLFKPHYI